MHDRYLGQLLHGCSEPECQTSTCLSFRKRRANKPFRPYTLLSARALASFLASQDQPEKGLCPHPAKQQRGGSGPDLGSCDDPSGDTRGHPGSNDFREVSKTSRIGRSENPPKAYTGEHHDHSTHAAGQRKDRDAKSFTQSFFDTVAISSLYESRLSTDVKDTSSADHQIAKDNIELLGRMRLDEAICKPRVPELYRHQHRAWQAMQVWPMEDVYILPFPVDWFPASYNFTLAYFSFWRLLDLEPGHCMTDSVGGDYHLFPMPSKPSSKRLVCFREFLRRSISYIFSTRSAILRSFVEWKQGKDSSITARSHALSMIMEALGSANVSADPAFTLYHVWSSVGIVFMHPLISDQQHCPASRLGDGWLPTNASLNHTVDEALSDSEAAHVLKIAIAALLNSAYPVVDKVMDAIQILRSRGLETPGDGRILEAAPRGDFLRTLHDITMATMDRFEDELAISLAVRIAKAMASRQWLDGDYSQKDPEVFEKAADSLSQSSFMMLVLRNVADQERLQVRVDGSETPPSLSGGICLLGGRSAILRTRNQHEDRKLLRLLLEWMRSVIVKGWDGKAEVTKHGAVGGAMEFLRYMCKVILFRDTVSSTDVNQTSAAPHTISLLKCSIRHICVNVLIR